MTVAAYKYKMLLAYDGTQYNGWQVQPNGVTIQEVLQEKLHILLKTKTSVTGAGRTDAGVHARGQVAHFRHDTELDLFRLRAGLNGLLPRDIRVKSIENAPSDFHARYSARNKVYHYHIHNGVVQDPFTRLYSWFLPQKLDIDRLRAGATAFTGTHNFSSFSNEASRGAAAANPVRTVKRLDVIVDGETIRLEFEAESFLYKMVRNITGFLVEIAKGKRVVEDVAAVLAAKDRRKAGLAAPPQGLFLIRVDYKGQ